MTRASLPDVPDLYEVCAAEGVELLRLHPLARVGRGIELVDGPGGGLGLDAAQLLRLRVVAEMLSTMGGPAVVADAPLAGELRALARDADARRRASTRPALADTVNPLVVREDGEVLPFAYGLPASCSLGTVGSFVAGPPAHRRGRPAAVLLSRAVESLPDDDGVCLDWEAHLVRCASVAAVAGTRTGSPAPRGPAGHVFTTTALARTGHPPARPTHRRAAGPTPPPTTFCEEG